MKAKSTWIMVFAGTAATIIAAILQAAPVGTAFTYQGRLMDGGSPANGTYDFNFSLWWESAGPSGMIAGPICRDQVDVVDGLFTVEVDFGAQFNGEARYLEISVRAYDSQFDCTSGSFTTLTPRQALRAAPYAMRALSAPNPSALDAPGGAPDVVSVDVTGNVGIGVTGSPWKLQISDPDPLMGLVESTSTIGTYFGVSNLSAGGHRWYLVSNGAVTGPAAGILTFHDQTANATRMAIDTNGNVGVGTTSPLSALHVSPSSGLVIGVNPLSGGHTALRMDLSAATGGYARIQAIQSSGSAWGNLALNAGGGDVGIGTAAPTAKLTVAGTVQSTSGGFKFPDGTTQLTASAPSTSYWTLDGTNLFNNNSGNVGVGTTNPTGRLEVAGGVRARGGAPGGFGINNNGYAFSGNNGDDDSGMFSSANGQLEFYTDATEQVRITPSGDVGIGISTPYGKLHVNGLAVLAYTQTNWIQILGGGDIAEPFDVQSSETIEPGMVVSIDPDNPGKLRLARSAYDRTVAGIISGAGGVKPGMTLQQKGSIADGEHPVALTGRVYCYVDADANGPVGPGDLLTTSSTPGHAMKVSDHGKAAGAILGKAMTSLPNGKGLVLVLVSLQ